jgi:biopolymer transport protein ExbB/TolQ
MLIILLLIFMVGIFLGLLLISLLSLGKAGEDAKEWACQQGKAIMMADSYHQAPSAHKGKKISRIPNRLFQPENSGGGKGCLNGPWTGAEL